MSGWKWASVDDLNGLFTYYLTNYSISEPISIGPGPDHVSEANSGWAPVFFSDGWISNSASVMTPNQGLRGYSSDLVDGNPDLAYTPQMWDQFWEHLSDSCASDRVEDKSTNLSPGAWFYRIEATDDLVLDNVKDTNGG